MVAVKGIHNFNSVDQSASVEYRLNGSLLSTWYLSAYPDWRISTAASVAAAAPIVIVQQQYDASIRWVEWIKEKFGPPISPQSPYKLEIEKTATSIEVKYWLNGWTGTQLLGVDWDSGDPTNISIAACPAIDITWADYRIYGRAWGEFFLAYEEFTGG
jgi:hypothetical protein